MYSISNFLYYRFNYIPFIKNFVSKLKLDNDKTIQFSLNIDGLPVFKNWPILASIDSYVFPLAMPYGRKPSNLLF